MVSQSEIEIGKEFEFNGELVVVADGFIGEDFIRRQTKAVALIRLPDGLYCVVATQALRHSSLLTISQCLDILKTTYG